MIGRIWYGWTSPENADAYETLLKTQIIPGIAARKIPGFRRIELMRSPRGDEVEFATMMWFDSLDAVQQFAGPQYDVAVVPPAARAVLKRFDATAKHYEIKDVREP